MKTRIFFFLFLVFDSYLGLDLFHSFTPTNSFTAANRALANSQKKIVILGDSLTEGYGVAQTAAFPALLQKKIDADQLSWKVISSGSSGSTSASGLQRMKWVAKNKPDYVLLLLGSNDGLRGLKVSETEKNLNQTIAWAQEQKMNIALGQLHVPPNYGKEYAKEFAAIYEKVARKNKIELLPFLLDKVAGEKDLNLADGIHPNEKGHAVIAENLYPVLKKQLEQQTHEKKPIDKNNKNLPGVK